MLNNSVYSLDPLTLEWVALPLEWVVPYPLEWDLFLWFKNVKKQCVLTRSIPIGVGGPIAIGVGGPIPIGVGGPIPPPAPPNPEFSDSKYLSLCSLIFDWLGSGSGFT